MASDRPPTIFVNGRFLGRPVTGVERFALMTLRALGAMPEAEALGRWEVLVPQGIPRPDGLGHMGFRETGSLKGHLWEQVDLARAARAGALVSLCNSGPLAHGRQLVVLHDAWVYRHPDHFSLAYRLFHQSLGRLIARRAALATVSQFSQRELAEILHKPSTSIPVVPNAADHSASIVADTQVIERFGLGGRPFFLFVGSPAPNKNLGRAILAFKDLARPDIQLVLVGSAAACFADGALGAIPDNVTLTGRLTDGEIKTLYAHALALVFPSIYEGFGIPPLEAMSAGCPVLAADIPAVREVCGDAAAYFDPFDRTAIAGAMEQMADGRIDRAGLIENGHARTRLFSWRHSADALLKAVSPLVSH